MFSYFSCVGFRPFNPYFEILNEKISELISAGIVQHTYRNLTRMDIMRNVDDDIGPQVLTMEHLEIGFLICLVPLICAALAFLIEVLTHELARKIRKIISDIDLK